MLFVCEEWKKIRNYFNEFFVCLGIFVVAAFAGYYAALFVGNEAGHYYEQLRKTVVGGDIPENIFLYILGRNALVSFLVLVVGILTYSVWPVLVLLVNGAISGFIVKLQSLLFHRNSFEIWLYGLLPHGVPELGALFLAAGATFYYRRLRKAGGFKWSAVMQTYLLVILPLLTLAAIIETFVTPLLIHRLLF